MRKKLLVDTNVLLEANQSGFLHELESSYKGFEACTVESVRDEIITISETGTSRKAQAAKLAKSIISNETLYIVPEFAKYADDALLEAAKQLPAALATKDRQLQKRARKSGVETYTVTKKGRLRKIN